jgi:hypothetical protein
MVWAGRFVVSVVVLAALPALAADELAARAKRAQDEARANAATPEGREWLRDHSHATDRLMILVLNRCLPDAPGGDDDEIPTAFAVFVRLSRQGKASEIVTELDAALSTCMTKAAGELPFPEAPRDDYWIQVNLAAPL